MIEECTPTSISTTAPVLQNVDYSVGSGLFTSLVFPQFTSTPAWCEFTYEYASSPAIPPTSGFTFDPVARQYTVLSTDLDIDDTYVITITAVRLNSKTPLAASFSFDLKLVDPCETATLQLDLTFFR